MPLLFSLGIHDSLCEVRNRLRPEDTIFAYLDDVYVSSLPIKTRDGYDLLEEQLLAGVGIQLHTGKYPSVESCRHVSSPPLPPPPSGRLRRASGAKMASRFWERLVRQSSCIASLRGDLEGEGSLWEAVTWVRDLQSVADSPAVCWATLPPPISHIAPSQSTKYAFRHDDGLRAMGALLGGLTGTEEDLLTARHLALLPMCLGGVGLRSAARSVLVVMADAIQMIHERLPQVARHVVDRLDGVQEVEGCIRELHDVTVKLDRQGFVRAPGLGRVGIGSSATTHKRH